MYVWRGEAFLAISPQRRKASHAPRQTHRMGLLPAQRRPCHGRTVEVVGSRQTEEREHGILDLRWMRSILSNLRFLNKRFQRRDYKCICSRLHMQHCNIKLSQTACSVLKHPVVVVISLGTRDDESMRGRSGGFGRLRLRWGMRERISDFQTRREWSQNTQPSPREMGLRSGKTGLRRRHVCV